MIRFHDCSIIFRCIGFLILFTHLIFSQTPNYDDEINEYKQKLKIINDKIESVQNCIKGDKKTSIHADSIYQNNRKNLTQYKDSLYNQFLITNTSSDSILILIENIKRQIQNLQISQNLFRDNLIRSCNIILDKINSLPPSSIQSQVNSLQFLKSEISGNAVENTEAVERLYQIMSTINSMASSIEVYTAPSPVINISKDFFFIRIGLAYLGIVDEKGENAFLWIADSSDKGGHWSPVENFSDKSAMLKSAKIRQGNSVPEIVELPFRNVVISDLHKE
jgi:hypothetical protein